MIYLATIFGFVGSSGRDSVIWRLEDQDHESVFMIAAAPEHPSAYNHVHKSTCGALTQAGGHTLAWGVFAAHQIEDGASRLAYLMLRGHPGTLEWFAAQQVSDSQVARAETL